MPIESKVNQEFKPSCEHDGYCYKLTTMPKAHCSEDYMNACGRVKDFYDKYGDVPLGVGATMFVPGSENSTNGK